MSEHSQIVPNRVLMWGRIDRFLRGHEVLALAIAAVGIEVGLVTELRPFSGVRTIPIAQNGQGGFGAYREGPTLIASQKEFEEFVKIAEAQEKWEDRGTFVRAMKDAKIDFEKESLVFLTQHEGAANIVVRFEVSRFEKGTLTIKIHREVPRGLLWAGAIHCYAVVVAKDRFKALEIWEQRMKAQVPKP